MKRLQKVSRLSNTSFLHSEDQIKCSTVQFVLCQIPILQYSPFLELVCVSAGSRPPLIVQPLHLDGPAGTAPDVLLMSADRRKKKQKEKSKGESEEMEENTLYGIVSSPSDDSSRLTLKLSRVKTADLDRPRELSQQTHTHSDRETESVKNNNQLSRTAQDLSRELAAEEQSNCQQVPVWQSTKDSAVVGEGSVFDDAEMDPLAEMERIERETASERERWSKEVQDKGSVCPVPSCIIYCVSRCFNLHFLLLQISL